MQDVTRIPRDVDEFYETFEEAKNKADELRRNYFAYSPDITVCKREGKGYYLSTRFYSLGS